MTPREDDDSQQESLTPAKTSLIPESTPRGEEPATYRFLGGHPDAEEIAAVVTVLTALETDSDEQSAIPAPGMWARPRHVRHQYPRRWTESVPPRSFR